MKNIIDGTYFYFELEFIQFVLHDVFLVSIYLLQDLFALIAPVVVEIGSREQPTLQTDIPIPIPTLFLTFELNKVSDPADPFSLEHYILHVHLSRTH